MAFTHYGFKNCLGGFFQMSTANARSILPPHLQPLEAQHTRSVLAVMAFQFWLSEVGAYDELVLAIITPPWVAKGEALPKAAFYPFMVATSTDQSRRHGTERWHLPHYPRPLDFHFREGSDDIAVHVSDAGTPVLQLDVSQYRFAPAVNAYQAFTIEGGHHRAYKVDLYMRAPHSEHEAETGRLVLHEHPVTERLILDEVEPIPFREEWYKAGRQTFRELELLLVGSELLKQGSAEHISARG